MRQVLIANSSKNKNITPHNIPARARATGRDGAQGKIGGVKKNTKKTKLDARDTLSARRNSTDVRDKVLSYDAAQNWDDLQ